MRQINRGNLPRDRLFSLGGTSLLTCCSVYDLQQKSTHFSDGCTSRGCGELHECLNATSLWTLKHETKTAPPRCNSEQLQPTYLPTIHTEVLPPSSASSAVRILPQAARGLRDGMEALYGALSLERLLAHANASRSLMLKTSRSRGNGDAVIFFSPSKHVELP